MTIGSRIKELREQKGMTLADLGSAANVNRATIQRYESGVITNIPSDRITNIAKALNVLPSYLMGWDNSECIPSIMTGLETDILSVLAKKEGFTMGDLAKNIKDYCETKDCTKNGYDFAASTLDEHTLQDAANAKTALTMAQSWVVSDALTALTGEKINPAVLLGTEPYLNPIEIFGFETYVDPNDAYPKLKSKFKKLNSAGKEYILDQIEFALSQEKYTK